MGMRYARWLKRIKEENYMVLLHIIINIIFHEDDEKLFFFLFFLFQHHVQTTQTVIKVLYKMKKLRLQASVSLMARLHAN